VESPAKLGELGPHFGRRPIEPSLGSLVALGICHITSISASAAAALARFSWRSAIRIGRLATGCHAVQHFIQVALLVRERLREKLVHPLFRALHPELSAAFEECPPLLIR
jgi:hypothetical protein